MLEHFGDTLRKGLEECAIIEPCPQKRAHCERLLNFGEADPSHKEARAKMRQVKKEIEEDLDANANVI